MRKLLTGILVLVAAITLFFKDALILGKALIPGDIVVGMYYPWLSQKWGYSVGVPVKNPMISDVVSQMFIWKQLVAGSLKQFELPLWNPYSYSGYPLLANYQSGALYPFNLLMTVLGDISGWNALLIGGAFGSAFSMFLFLKYLRMTTAAAVAAGLSYALSMYAVTWMEFVTTAQLMVWFPLMLLSAHLAVSGKRIWYWLWPPLLFLGVTAGRFEVLVYMLSTVCVYALYLGYCARKWKWLRDFLILGVLGLGLGALQIVPTIELGQRSVRFAEEYIVRQHWGLIPAIQLITGIAPDFFGNPATGNHWGWWQYHETVFYTGVLAVVALCAAGLSYRRLGKYTFFFWLAVGGLTLGTSSPAGELVYRLKVPVLSTVSAGRVFILYVLGASVLIGWWIDGIKTARFGLLVRSVLYPLLALTMAAVAAFVVKRTLIGDFPPLPLERARLLISVRNSVIPAGLLIVTGIFLPFRKFRLLPWLYVALVICDLTRAGWKYLPQIDPKLIFPSEPVISFLTRQAESDIFRVDREHGEVMPPNTWAAYKLMSTSGYDPLAVGDYVRSYDRDLNGSTGGMSRYSELGRYDAQALGSYNVRYLLAIKRDEKSKIPGDKLSHLISEKDWKRVFETPNVAVLENTRYQPRVRLLPGGQSEIESYLPGRVSVVYSGSQGGGNLVLADAFFPGWQACENGMCRPAGKDGPWLSARISAGSGRIDFVYRPVSFLIGCVISFASLLGWLMYTGLRFRSFSVHRLP